ncbi:FMN-binding negative transcriptional regulator [Leeia oryzae]|uniref:FMN-binding negative transcriptional regulator n=1 Tax=Leeia oryzae TaxID=356662 RepID=UPI00037782C4|nr:FMN-binding negative transcriptional regulator [Leeia oryzae]
MYCPASFRQDDPDTLRSLISHFPLGTIFTSVNGLEANAVPFLLVQHESGQTLQAHIARANPQLAAFRTGCEVLVVFYGPDAYVTPGWYPSKKENGKQVPTWNYTMIQVKGKIRVVDDQDWVYQQIGRLSNQQESGRADPWHITDAPVDYIETQMKAIIGIEIAIDEIKGKFKLSQNRSQQDFQGVENGLRSEGKIEIADYMQTAKGSTAAK